MIKQIAYLRSPAAQRYSGKWTDFPVDMGFQDGSLGLGQPLPKAGMLLAFLRLGNNLGK